MQHIIHSLAHIPKPLLFMQELICTRVSLGLENACLVQMQYKSKLSNTCTCSLLAQLQPSPATDLHTYYINRAGVGKRFGRIVDI